MTALRASEIRTIREQFPILDERIGDSPLVYLDTGATAQRPLRVLEKEHDFLVHRNASVHRGAHTLAALATDEFEDARGTVARFVGAGPNEIVYTAGATDALNMVAISIAKSQREPATPIPLDPGDEILVTEAEHHANLIPWQELAAATGSTLRWVPVRDDGTWTLDDALAHIGPHTRIVAFAHVSNVTGLIAPVAALTRAAHEAGAVVVLDACQSVPHLPVDFAALGVDFAAFSSHKMLGPSGIGVLYGRRDLLAALPPARTGGSMITSVTMERAEFLEPPSRFEAGTQAVPQAIGLAEAVRMLDEIGMDRIEGREIEIADRLTRGIVEMPGVRLVGPAPGEPRAGLASVVVEGVHAHDVGQVLDAQGIAVRVGHHCAQPLHRRLGVAATTRASGYLYTTDDEIDRFLDALAGVRAYFGVAHV